MNIEEFRDYCLKKPGTSEKMPFGPDTLVFYVGKKMFALCGLDPFDSINLKCDPGKSLDLREHHPAIRPGYHMNKKHWNTLDMDGSLDELLIRRLIDHSYQLVFQSLPATQRAEIIK